MRKVDSLLKNGDIKSVLDIGANIGNFSRYVRSVYPSVDIFMIEANPFCDNMLRSTGLEYEIVCLSNDEKQVTFYVENDNYVGTGASYYLEKTEHYSRRNFINLDTKRLDDVIVSKYGETKAFDLIKLDTQGSEIDIMKGGLETINKSKFVLIETSLIEYNENSPLKKDVFSFMKELGFNPLEKVQDQFHNGSLIQEDWIFSR
jgi:FkbM family methyltransferase